MLPCALARHLHRWVQGSPPASLFDNADGTADLPARPGLRLRAWTTFHFDPPGRCCSTSSIGRTPPSRTAASTTMPTLLPGRSLALCPAPEGQGLHHRRAQDLAQAKRGDDPRHAEQRGLPRSGPLPHGHRRAVRPSSSWPIRISTWAASALPLNHTQGIRITHYRRTGKPCSNVPTSRRCSTSPSTRPRCCNASTASRAKLARLSLRRSLMRRIVRSLAPNAVVPFVTCLVPQAFVSFVILVVTFVTLSIQPPDTARSSTTRTPSSASTPGPIADQLLHPAGDRGDPRLRLRR